jgi:cleavage and polyadenylation specificity factor subunit 3
MDHFEDIGPSVVMASPGMMQSGLSRELFENWCTDKRNGVIIAGYCVEGTLAKVSWNDSHFRVAQVIDYDKFWR